MNELIIIKTNNSQEVKKLLEEKPKKNGEEELGKAYREAWSNPQRYQEAQRWEQAAVSDWAERVKKDKK